jgi:hypothetical protein
MEEKEKNNSLNSSQNTEVSDSIFDLIQSIQSKLNIEQEEKSDNIQNESNANTETNDVNTSNIDYTYENNTMDNNNNFDFSNIFSMLKDTDLSSLIGSFTKKNENNSSNENSEFGFGDIDKNMLSRIQKLLFSMNKKDPKKNLLLSLKPFLRQSRQDKLGEYISILSVVNALDLFGSKGGDKDV